MCDNPSGAVGVRGWGRDEGDLDLEGAGGYVHIENASVVAHVDSHSPPPRLPPCEIGKSLTS